MEEQTTTELVMEEITEPEALEGHDLCTMVGGPFDGKQYYVHKDDDVRAVPVQESETECFWYPYKRMHGTVMFVWDERKLDHLDVIREMATDLDEDLSNWGN